METVHIIEEMTGEDLSKPAPNVMIPNKDDNDIA
jgi:hypothetical protein